MKRLIAVAAACLLVSACQPAPIPQGKPPSPSSSATSATSSDPAVRPPGPCEGSSGGKQSHMQLVRLEVSAHGNEDWVVFEFEPRSGPSDAPPIFDLKNVSPPFSTDPADEPMQVDGEEFFQLIFQGASGVEIEGETPRRTYTGPSELKPGGDVVQEVEQQGDFEATLSWIIGLSLHSCPSVSQLADPPRLVLRFPR